MSGFSPASFLPDAFGSGSFDFSSSGNSDPAYLDTSFSRAAFSDQAYSFETLPAPEGVSGPRPSGGFPAYDRGRTRKEILKDRERFGIPDKERLEAEAIIADVAARQARTLERDAQKRFEELSRELELKKINWDTRYLSELNSRREKLIDAEIASRLKRLMDEQEIAIILMLVAASV